MGQHHCWEDVYREALLKFLLRDILVSGRMFVYHSDVVHWREEVIHIYEDGEADFFSILPSIPTSMEASSALILG